MSRVGLSSIKIPEGVSVTQTNNTILAKGKNGELSIDTHDLINVKIDNTNAEVFLKESGNLFDIFLIIDRILE